MAVGAVVVEAALSRPPEISTLAHVYLLVSAKNGKTVMPYVCAHDRASRSEIRPAVGRMGVCQLNVI